MRDDATAVEVSGRRASQTVELGARAPRRRRLLEGMRRPANWVQLIQFGIVGGIGFVINLAVYALCVHVLKIDYHVANVLAWLVAVLNNFVLNRRWTFDARDIGKAHHQALRFLLVSLAAEGVSLGLLQLFVDADIGKVPAQALAVALSMPLNFLGNKLWSFRLPA